MICPQVLLANWAFLFLLHPSLKATWVKLVTALGLRETFGFFLQYRKVLIILVIIIFDNWSQLYEANRAVSASQSIFSEDFLLLFSFALWHLCQDMEVFISFITVCSCWQLGFIFEHLCILIKLGLNLRNHGLWHKPYGAFILLKSQCDDLQRAPRG